MSRQGHVSGLSRGHGSGSLNRAEPAPDDDRPFAEIRKNLQDVLRMLSLHRWAFFIPFCIVASAAFILSLSYPRTYSARTGFERRNDPILADLSMSRGAATFKLFRTTIARDLTSVECMAEVMANIGLTKDFERNEDGTLTKASIRRRSAVALALGERIRIATRQPNDQVDIIDISYTGPDPHIGKKLLDEVKATYIRRTMAWVQQHLEGLREYYAAETEEALERLRAVEREQTRLRLENPYINPQNPGAISARLSQLEMEKHELLRRRREYQADLDAQEQMLASLESRALVQTNRASQDGPAAKDNYLSSGALRLMGLLDEIDQKIGHLKSTRGMTDEHPEIKELLASLRWRQSELEAQTARDRQVTVTNVPLEASAGPVGTSVGASLDPWQGDRARLLAQIAAQQAKIKDVTISLETNGHEIARLTKAKDGIYDLQDEYADVEARVAKARKHHHSLAATLAKVEPAIKANQQNKLVHWSVGQPARGGSIPVNPKARTVVLLALLAGIAAGVVFVILGEILDHVYRSSGQVARSLGLPILDAIDDIVTSQDRRRLLIRRTVVTPLVVLACVGLMGVTGSLAYLSIQQPYTYERIQRIPRATLEFFAGTTPTPQTPPAAGSQLKS